MAYFGVPDGFAVVTRLEQTDSRGVPLSNEARWSAGIVLLKSFSIEEYLRALLTSPPGYFRIIVLVISSKPFNFSGARARLDTIEQWSRSGLNTLPEEVRAQSYTSAHVLTAFVYEFKKLKDNESPSVFIPGRITVSQHLLHTKFARYVH